MIAQFRIWTLLTLVTLLCSCTNFRRIVYNAPEFSDQYLFKYVEAQPAESPSAIKEAEDLNVLGEQIKIAPHLAALSLMSMEDYLGQSATLGFAIFRNDSLLYERYSGVARSAPLTSFSVAKTFTGSLIALAIQDGFIGSLEDPVQKYLPDFPFSDVLLRHLMDQVSGLDFPAEGAMYYARDISQISHKVKRRWDVEEDWRYENGNTQLLGLILEKATSKPLETYLQEKIWQPMGAEGPVRWSTDDKGMPKAFCCMNAMLRDYGRFGLVMLHDGFYNGTQILPEGFISESVNFATDGGRFSRYKNQIWLEHQAAGTHAAIGLYGQYIYIYPPKNIVIVRFAKENPHLHAAWSEFFNTVIEQL